LNDDYLVELMKYYSTNPGRIGPHREMPAKVVEVAPPFTGRVGGLPAFTSRG